MILIQEALETVATSLVSSQRKVWQKNAKEKKNAKSSKKDAGGDEKHMFLLTYSA